MSKLESFYGRVETPPTSEDALHARLSAVEALAKLQHDYSMGHINPQLMPSRIEIDGVALVYMAPQNEPPQPALDPRSRGVVGPSARQMATAEQHPMPQPLSPPHQQQSPAAAHGDRQQAAKADGAMLPT